MRKSTPDMIENYEVIAGHDLEGGNGSDNVFVFLKASHID
jgi:hypothetical protein